MQGGRASIYVLLCPFTIGARELAFRSSFHIVSIAPYSSESLQSLVAGKRNLFRIVKSYSLSTVAGAPHSYGRPGFLRNLEPMTLSDDCN